MFIDETMCSCLVRSADYCSLLHTLQLVKLASDPCDDRTVCYCTSNGMVRTKEAIMTISETQLWKVRMNLLLERKAGTSAKLGMSNPGSRNTAGTHLMLNGTEKRSMAKGRTRPSPSA